MNYQLNRLGITDLNAMQQETIQAFRKTQSLVLLSPTGSGKTLAYLLPLLETIKVTSDSLQAMVIVPSRELAMQTLQVIKQLGSPVRAVAVYGGRPTMDEHRTLRGVLPQLIIGTPGRLLDHLTKSNIQPSSVHTLVIDEFDKCLELGFKQEMGEVLSYLPEGKRILLSATDRPEIPDFVGTGTQPLRLNYLTEEEPVPDRIDQYFVKSPLKDKLETLKALLLHQGSQTSIVFVGFRESVERVAMFLHNEGFYVSALHGGMEQKDRERQLFRFICGSTNVLVSTDLASRGLDIPELNNVIHYHLPLDEQAYIHRNGRTARWDKSGRSFLILGPEEQLPEYAASASSFIPSVDNGVCPPIWETLYIGKGKKDKLSRGDIAGFLMKVGGLNKEDVGRIDVRDHQSYVAISRKRVSETLVRLRGQKIKGIKTIFERIR